MKSKAEQRNAFHSPLKPKDSEFQTEGCRHTNPDICASNALPKVCAFARSDGMCVKPPKSWPKQYKALLTNTELENVEGLTYD